MEIGGGYSGVLTGAGLSLRLFPLAGVYLGIQAGGAYFSGNNFTLWTDASLGYEFRLPGDLSTISLSADLALGVIPYFSNGDGVNYHAGRLGGILGFEIKKKWLIEVKFSMNSYGISYGPGIGVSVDYRIL